MALIRYVEGQQRSGSIGATVYSHNRAGQYIRARSVPVNPSSVAQNAVRSAMLAAQAAWQGRTDEQRAGWDAYAQAVSWVNRLGNAMKLTGQQHFLRCASIGRYTGCASGLDGMLTEQRLPSPDETADVAIEAGSDAVSLSYGSATDAWKSIVGGYLFLFGGYERLSSRSFYGGPYRYIGKVAGASTPPTSPAALDNPLCRYNVAGHLVKFYVRTYIPAIGLSEPRYINATVAAAS